MALKSRQKDVPQRAQYSEYKRYLRQDFAYCCVFCNLHENELGGPRAYAVEHLRPRKHFPLLACDYNNLLYACHVCNSFKLDDWPSEDPITDGKGYLDPCHHDYDLHFFIDQQFRIGGKTDVGKYMATRLHLDRNQISKNLSLRSRAEIQHLKKIDLTNKLIKALRSTIESEPPGSPAVEQLLNEARAVSDQLAQWELDWQRRWEPRVDLEDYR